MGAQVRPGLQLGCLCGGEVTGVDQPGPWGQQEVVSNHREIFLHHCSPECCPVLSLTPRMLRRPWKELLRAHLAWGPSFSIV